MQGSTEMPLPGLVSFVPARDFCFNLPPTISQPSNLVYSVSLNEPEPMSMSIEPVSIFTFVVSRKVYVSRFSVFTCSKQVYELVFFRTNCLNKLNLASNW